MRLLKKLFVIVVALCLVGIGQVVYADGVCEEFRTFETPWGVYCQDVYYIPWVAFGGGWKTILRGANLSEQVAKGIVSLTFDLFPSGGPYNPDGHFQSLNSIFSVNKGILFDDLHIGSGSSIILSPGASVEMNLLYTPAGCDKYGNSCQSVPDPEDKISVGSASAVYYMSVERGAPGALRGLPKPSAQFNHVSGLQGTEPAFTPAPLWRVPVSATVDRKKEFMFAIGNPYPEDTEVQGKLFNQDGKVLGNQSWTIPGQNTRALYLTNAKNDPMPGFGDDPFPDGKDCTGWLELRVISPTTGLISIVGLQATDSVMSSADVQPFYPKQ